MSTAANGLKVFMPPQGTEVAGQVDTLYKFILIASFIACVLVIGGMIAFAIKYRRKSEGEKTPYLDHNTALEFTWSFIPFVIFMLSFVWGWKVFHTLRKMPVGGLEIAVQAQKWDWTFVYKSGRRVASEFYVPVNQDVKLIMTSSDVIHSFYVPAFRNKQDVVPGRYTALWFNANREGIYQIFCAEYCGDRHSGMMGKVHVVSREKYEAWLASEPYKGLSSVEIGQKIYGSRCVACHTLTESKNVGPGFKGVFGRQEKIEGGETITVDENYIRESVVNPNAKIVAGFPKGIMPTFQGQLSEEELMGIIDYLKTVK